MVAPGLSIGSERSQSQPMSLRSLSPRASLQTAPAAGVRGRRCPPALAHPWLPDPVEQPRPVALCETCWSPRLGRGWAAILSRGHHRFHLGHWKLRGWSVPPILLLQNLTLGRREKGVIFIYPEGENSCVSLRNSVFDFGRYSRLWG